MDRINLTKRLIEVDGTNLIPLIDLFLTDTTIKRTSLTLHNQRYQLSLFRRWWTEAGPACGFILTKDKLAEFTKWLEVQPNRQAAALSVSTINRAIKMARQCLTWAFDCGYITTAMASWIPTSTRLDAPTQPKELPAGAELAALFRAAEDSGNPARNKAILAVLIGTGVRRAECSNLNLQDVKFDKDKRSGSLFVAKGKGHKSRYVLFDEYTGKYLVAHITTRGRRPGPLFRSQRGGRLGPKAVYDVVKDCARRAGLQAKIQGPHDLRRLFATHWTRIHRGEGFVQPLSLQLGHVDPKMTLHYSKQTLADTEKIFTSPMKFAELGREGTAKHVKR